MATTRNLVPPGAIGNGPMMSIPHYEKGHADIMDGKLANNSFAFSRPANSASYSASFIRPAPEPSKLEASLVNNFHAFFGSVSFLFASLSFTHSSSFKGVSNRKSDLDGVSLEISPESPGGIYEGCVQLTKYTGICFLPLPTINTALKLSSEAMRYIIKVSPLMGAVTVSSASKSSFILRKASSAFAIYWTIFSLVQLLSVRIKGSVLSAPFERKRFRATNFLLRFYISLTDLGGCSSEISFTFEGLAFIPCLVMRCLENISSSTPKEHFFGLSFRLIA
nr:hypothetical protein [Tanacetum cinerariifolium]